MAKMLTKKQKMVITFMLEGKNQTQATKLAYNCKNDASARALASKIMKNPAVCEELALRKEAAQTIITHDLANSSIDFVNKLIAKIPDDILQDELLKILQGSDTRSKVQVIELITKLRGLQIQKSQILMKADIYEDVKSLPEVFPTQKIEEGLVDDEE